MQIWITRRRYRRTRFEGKVRYQVGREVGGHALIHDVDQGGVCLSLSHPLRAGQRIVLDVEGPRPGSGSFEFLGVVAWCRAAVGGHRAGIRVYEDFADVRRALTELVCEGIKRMSDTRALRNRHFRYVEYGKRAAGEPGSSMWKQVAPRGSWKPSAAVQLGF